MTPLKTLRTWWPLLAVLLLATLLRGFNLHFPGERYFDEIYYVDGAMDYLESRPDSNNVHPTLAKLQLAAALLCVDATRCWGWHQWDGVIGWRLAPFLAGVGVVALTAWLAYSLIPNRRLACTAALLVAIEHLSNAESRIATLDNLQAFWITLGLGCAARRLFRSNSDSWIWASGLAFGVATGCKWNGLFPAAGTAACLWGLVTSSPELRRPHRLKVALIYALTIGGVYALSYLPYRNLYPEKPLAKVVEEIKGQHLRMWNFRKDPKQFKHQYLSHFYQWPFVARPVWFHYKSHAKSRCTGIVAFGMIPFWWFAIYLTLESCITGYQRSPQGPGDGRDRGSQFLAVAYLSQWLFWATRLTRGFFYYMLPVVPVMAVLVARQLEAWWQSGNSGWAGGYLALLGSVSLLYYPFACGLEVPYKYFQVLFFMDNWV